MPNNCGTKPKTFWNGSMCEDCLEGCDVCVDATTCESCAIPANCAAG